MKRSALCRMTGWLVLSTLLLAGADWPRFLGPKGDGISEAKGLPTTWSAASGVVWKTELPGPGASSPITTGDKVLVTAYSGYAVDPDNLGKPENLQRHVLCLERASGKVLWQKTVKASLPEQSFGGFLALHGYASSTPATDGKAVYAFFGRSGVYAFSLAGDELWHADVGSGTHNWGSAASPILAGDLVIVNASVESGALVALNKATGKQAWRVGGSTRSWSTPALVDLPGGKQELVVSVQDKVLGLAPATGKELWTCDGVKDYVCPAVAVHGDVVYVTAGRKPHTVAVRAGGQGDVTKSHTVWTSDLGSKVPTPLVTNGLLYWVEQTGKVACLAAADGSPVYQERLKLPGSGDKVYASLVLADGKLYAVTRQGGTLVLAVGKEFKELARNDLGDKSIFNATPAISNGQLLLRSNRCLYCIGK